LSGRLTKEIEVLDMVQFIHVNGFENNYWYSPETDPSSTKIREVTKSKAIPKNSMLCLKGCDRSYKSLPIQSLNGNFNLLPLSFIISDAIYTFGKFFRCQTSKKFTILSRSNSCSSSWKV
jgi:hypothetical protein